MEHPFKPYIIKTSKNLVIGTLPPDDIKYYYSNSVNTRMWDLLKSIRENTLIQKNSYLLPISDKKKILNDLNLSMTDIIFKYEREKESTDDNDIIPMEYNNIGNIIKDTTIVNLLFVYESALKWFLHSLEKSTPVKLNKLPKLEKKEYGIICNVILNDKKINCILLPNPLSRGKKGETLEFKKRIYSNHIL